MATEDKTEKDFSKGAAKALLASVENLDNDAASIEAYCLPLLRVFNPTSPGEYLGASRTAKQQETLLLDLLRSPNKALQKRFFSGLHSIVEVIIAEEAYVPESAYLDDSGDDGVDAEKQGEDRKSAACLSLLKYAALCAEAALEGRVEQKQGSAMQLQVMPQVYEVALQLHTILLSVHDCGAEGLGTRNAILSLCESWWLANAVSRDSLIAQVLPLLVLQASDTTELQKSHIKKLLTFKDAFQVIDFLNPSSESLRSLLLKVASNPLCLKLPEGRKFLTSLFRDPDLVPDLHLSFRAQIPHASKTILQAYGEIYFKAWCEAEDASETDTQEVIEHQVLQDLMHAAIHVASPAMAKSLSTTLTPLHSDKKAKRVADLLSRLYGPILWRSLTAANPLVRRNAVSILEQVFPLHDPNQNQMKASMEKCAAALKNALQDVDPKVRIAASEATANICALFWEALPSSDIRMLLSRKFNPESLYLCVFLSLSSTFANDTSVQMLFWSTHRISLLLQFVLKHCLQRLLYLRFLSPMQCFVHFFLRWEI
jgi:condensin-2 complex subunit G2